MGLKATFQQPLSSVAAYWCIVEMSINHSTRTVGMKLAVYKDKEARDAQKGALTDQASCAEKIVAAQEEAKKMRETFDALPEKERIVARKETTLKIIDLEAEIRTQQVQLEQSQAIIKENAPAAETQMIQAPPNAIEIGEDGSVTLKACYEWLMKNYLKDGKME